MIYLFSLVSEDSGSEDGYINNNYNSDKSSEKVASIVEAQEERVQGTVFIFSKSVTRDSRFFRRVIKVETIVASRETKQRDTAYTKADHLVLTTPMILIQITE